MSKKRKSDQGLMAWGSQRRFEDSDFAWLAEQFQKQKALNSDLTVEEFAMSHGVQAEWISRAAGRFYSMDRKPSMSIGQASEYLGASTKTVRRWIGSGALKAELVQGRWMVRPGAGDSSDEGRGKTVTLWHGTTMDRARAIMQGGFRVRGSVKRGIWFTTDPDVAYSRAIRRAQEYGQVPAVLLCEIDLEKYPKFVRWMGQKFYAFFYPHIDKGVIRSLSVVDEKKGKRSIRKGLKSQIDAMVTKTSGKLGVLWWVNHYLELKGETPLSEDHPALEAILEWIETQYAAGRDEPISDEEMSCQVRKFLGLENI
jgi:excisionase family DNA binding protein